jgi:hypothetical protein
MNLRCRPRDQFSKPLLLGSLQEAWILALAVCLIFFELLNFFDLQLYNSVEDCPP